MFFKENTEINLGETTIPNIFIDIFMPMADGLYVKIYLLGYRQACDGSSNPNFNNSSISKNLNVPLSDVLNAWKFWEEKKIIKIHNDNDEYNLNYSIEFLDLKSFYINNMLNNTPKLKQELSEDLLETENQEIKNMFIEIKKISNRVLEPSEKKTILNIIDKFNVTTDLIIFAYEYAKKKNGVPKPARYIESIIKGWYDSNLHTLEDVKNSFLDKENRFKLYKTIFNELGFYRIPTRVEKEIMDTWLDKFNMNIDIIIEACSKSKNIASPSIAYINGIVKNWYEEDIKSLADLNKSKEKALQRNKKGQDNNNIVYKKTKFHNFNETFTQYTSDELDEIIKKSQKEKFKNVD
ncbi:dnaD domain protein [Clostridioides difficile CD160]|nr:dnaD domain protein [Clostridioides difficile CD160]